MRYSEQSGLASILRGASVRATLGAKHLHPFCDEILLQVKPGTLPPSPPPPPRVSPVRLNGKGAVDRHDLVDDVCLCV